MYTENNTTEEAFVSALKSAVDAVKTDADLDELNRLKKLFKQTVPFNLRSYVGAYLAKQLCSRVQAVLRATHRARNRRAGQ